MSNPPPVKMGQEVTATVGPLADGPDSICRVDNYVLFVRGGLPGETLRLEVTDAGRKHGRAKILEIVTPSEHRTEAQCEHFGTCAGCSSQNLDYTAHCEEKHAHVAKLISGQVGRDLEVAPMRHPAAGYAQRHRLGLRLHGEPGALRGTLRGLARDSHVDVRECPAVEPRVMAVALAVIAKANKHKLPMAEADVDGLVGLLIRSAPSTGELHVTVVGNVGRMPHGLRLSEAAAELGATSVSLNINLEFKGQFLGRRNVPLLGFNHIKFAVDGVTYHAAPSTPFEWSEFGTQAIVDIVNTLTVGDQSSSAVDIFAGGGLLTLQLARRFDKVIGIGPFRDATTDAEASARANEMENVEFMQGNVQDITLDLDTEFPATVTVTPPVSGLRPDMITGIARILRPQRIVIVSSSPGSLSRDLKRIEEHPYRVHSVHPIDMLPMSTQTTIVAALDRHVD